VATASGAADDRTRPRVIGVGDVDPRVSVIMTPFSVADRELHDSFIGVAKRYEARRPANCDASPCNRAVKTKSTRGAVGASGAR